MLGDPYLALYVFASYTTISFSACTLLHRDNLSYFSTYVRWRHKQKAQNTLKQ